MGVALIAVYVSLRLGKKSVDDLLDAAPSDLLAQVATAAGVDGVLGVSQVRVRQAGPATFTDVILEVAQGLSLEVAHEIAHRSEVAIREAVPHADVVVHAHPIDNGSGPQLLEDDSGLAITGVRLDEVRVVLAWRPDATAPGGAAARERAAALEKELQARFEGLAES